MPAVPPSLPDADGSPGLPTADEQAAALRRLTFFLRQANKFRLAVALYNDPVARDETIRTLAAELMPAGARVLTLDLHAPPAEATLLQRIEDAVSAAGAIPGERSGGHGDQLRNAEIEYTPETARPGGPGLKFLETANLHRDLFPGVCPGPAGAVGVGIDGKRPGSPCPRPLALAQPPLRPALAARKGRRGADHGGKTRMASNDFRVHPETRLRRLAEELAGYRKLVETGHEETRHDVARVLNSMGIARRHSG